MHLKAFATLLLITLTLAACSPVYKTDYRFTTPPDDIGKMCAVGCLDKLSACKAHCQIDQSNCKRIADLKGENRYLEYVAKQKEKGKPIKKSKSYFTSYAFCNTATCDQKCEESQRICHSSCGGNIIEERRCTAFCD